MESSEDLIQMLFVIIGGVTMLMLVTLTAIYALNLSRKRMVEAEKEKSRIALEEKQKMLKASIDASERERKKIAEELHDHINAQLTVVRLSLVRSDGSNDHSDAVSHLDNTIQELRGISRELMPPVLERFGLLDALDDLFDKIETGTDLKIEFDAPEEWKHKNLERDLSLYRIVQEFAQNTMKYAEATKLFVQVKVGEKIELTLKDDGKGFDPERFERGLGTRNMESRIQYLNGTHQLSSGLGEGVSLRIAIPIKTPPTHVEG